MQNYVKVMDFNCLDPDAQKIIGLLKWVFNAICIAIPVIIIILIVIDMAKVATAGNVDDKMKKEATQKAISRLIYSVIIFLVPTVVNMIFKMLPSDQTGQSFVDCWNGTSAKNPSGGNTNTRTIDKQNAKSLDDCNEAKGNWDTTSQICR